MPGPFDIQITIAQQVQAGYQQQLHQQQPIVVGEHQLSADKTKTQEAETSIQALEKGGQGIEIEEKRSQVKRGVQKRKRKEKNEEEKEEMASDGIRGKIIDVIG